MECFTSTKIIISQAAYKLHHAAPYQKRKKKTKCHIFKVEVHLAYNTYIELAQVEILLRSCKILQESCKILIKIKILIRSCLTFKILKNLSKNLVRS